MIAFVATICAGTFFGAALYISLAQHPASLDAGGEIPGAFFPPMYRRAAPMQVSLALAGTVFGIVEWVVTENLAWLFGAMALVSVVPITLIVLKPINDILLNPENDPASPATLMLLNQWGRRHWIRSIVSGCSFVIYLVAPAFGTP